MTKRALRTIHAQANVLVLHPRLGYPLDGTIPPRFEWVIRFGSSGYVLNYLLANGDIVVLALRCQREKG